MHRHDPCVALKWGNFATNCPAKIRHCCRLVPLGPQYPILTPAGHISSDPSSTAQFVLQVEPPPHMDIAAADAVRSCSSWCVLQVPGGGMAPGRLVQRSKPSRTLSCAGLPAEAEDAQRLHHAGLVDLSACLLLVRARNHSVSIHHVATLCRGRPQNGWSAPCPCPEANISCCCGRGRCGASHTCHTRSGCMTQTVHPTRIVESTGQASRKQTPQSGDGSAMRCFRGATLMCCVDLVRALLLRP